MNQREVLCKLFERMWTMVMRVLQESFPCSPSTHSNALCEAWVDDAVDAHSDVAALQG